MVNVTKTFLPPIEEYTRYLERIWSKNWLTNRGELVVELENKLKTFLDTSNVLLLNNGTIPIQIALKLVGKQGEIITTPFSYVATSSAIVWENCTPVFVDIDPEHLTIDESKIESAITKNTTAILATHVFGNPCNVEKIQEIANRHGIFVVYDAAHAFGVEYKERSLFNYGNVSTCSFHATKLFHTGEGGALVTKDKDLMHKAYYSHNFGHDGPLKFHGLGINGKMSELHAAMGLSVLPHMESIIENRKQVVNAYKEGLKDTNLKTIKIRENTKWNYSYFPIIFRTEEELLKVEEKLNVADIYPRRYFYPSLNTIGYIKGEEMPISERISKRILCLPLFSWSGNGEKCQQVNNIIRSTLC